MTTRKQKTTRASGRNTPERDDQGRFVSDDESSRSNGRRSSRQAQSRRRYDDEDSGSGWYGDPEGHAQASREGWAHRRGDRYDRYDDEDERYASRHGRGGSRYDEDGRGWYGDEEGHAQASRRGWQSRRMRDDEDDYRGSRRY